MNETAEEENFQERDVALEEIATRLGVRAERGRRFAELTSLRVGGAIDWVLSPDTEAQAAAAVRGRRGSGRAAGVGAGSGWHVASVGRWHDAQ